MSRAALEIIIGSAKVNGIASKESMADCDGLIDSTQKTISENK